MNSARKKEKKKQIPLVLFFVTFIFKKIVFNKVKRGQTMRTKDCRKHQVEVNFLKTKKKELFTDLTVKRKTEYDYVLESVLVYALLHTPRNIIIFFFFYIVLTLNVYYSITV